MRDVRSDLFTWKPDELHRRAVDWVEQQSREQGCVPGSLWTRKFMELIPDHVEEDGSWCNWCSVAEATGTLLVLDWES